jgi:hypothetical protein
MSRFTASNSTGEILGPAADFLPLEEEITISRINSIAFK